MEPEFKWVVTLLTTASGLLVFAAATLFAHSRDRQLSTWQLRALIAVHIALQVIAIVAFAAWQMSQPHFRYVFWWTVVMIPAWLPLSSFAVKEIRRQQPERGAQPSAQAEGPQKRGPRLS